MKKIIVLLAAFAAVFGTFSFAAFGSESEIGVTVNGSSLSFDQPPVVVNGRTLVPLKRFLRHWVQRLNGIPRQNQ